MATLYEYLADSTRAKYPLESLDPRAVKFLSTEVPAAYPQAKLQKVLSLAEGGISRYAVGGGGRQPAAPAAGQPQAATPEPQPAPAAAPKSRYQQLLETMPEGWRPTPGLTAEGYAALPRGGQLAAQAAEAMGAEFSMPRSGVPAPHGMAEHIAGIVGSLPAFAAKTAALAPFVGPAAAVGGSMAASRGSLKERAIRGATGAATAGVAGVAGRVVEPALGAAGHVAATAVGFGAAQPAAESLTHRLTGEPDYPAPTLADLVRGTAEMGVIAGAGHALGSMGGKEGSHAEVLGPDRQLPPRRLRANRQLPSPVENVDTGEPIPMGMGEGAPPAVFPNSRRLPQGPLPSSGEVIRMGPGKTVEQNRAPVLQKLAPEFAGDTRQVAAGRTVADVFHEMVQAEAGKGETRAEWKAATRRVVASGRIQAVQSIAEAMTEPGPEARRAPPELRAREARFSEELNTRAAGRTVELNISGAPVKLRIARVVSFRYPGVDRPVRVIAEDVTNGKLYPLQFRSVPELAQAVNNPQAMVKAEDVFARAERQRGVKAQATAGAGTGAGAPAAAKAAAPAEPVPSAPARAPRPERAGPTGAERGMGIEIPKGPIKDIPPEKAEEYVAKFVEGYTNKHAKASPETQAGIIERLKRRAIDSQDPVDRRAAVETLEAIRKGAAGSASEGGTGPSAPPAAPAKRERVVIGMDFADAKKAQAIADRMNHENADLEAQVVVRRGKPVVEVNKDAALSPPKPKPEAPPAPKAEPAAAPAAPESKPAPGFVRLYRVESTNPGRGLPDWVKQAAGEALGAWWTDNPESIEFYRRHAEEGGTSLARVRVMDLPEAEANKHRVSNLPEDHSAHQFSKRPSEEFFIPGEKKAAEGAAEAGRPAGGASEPPAAPAAEARGPEPNSPEDLNAMRDASRFKIDQRISVPNLDAAHNDARVRRKGYVVGWERGKDGEAQVRVKVPRGKSGWREFTVPESQARALPSKEARAAGVAKRAAAGASLADELYERAKGNPLAAREAVRKYEAQKNEALDKAAALTRPRSGNVAPENEAAHRKLRAAAVLADRGMNAAEAARQRIVKEAAGRENALHPDIVPFFERDKDFDAYVAPMREAAEDHPQHFTPERQARYLHRVAAYEIPNAREWKASIDFERGMAERGVSPEHAAHATEATERIRRLLEQDADNPLVDAADVEAARKHWLAPERVDTPEALGKTLAEFDATNPPGPADDIPAGVQPEPPAGFAEHLGERGIVNAEVLSPWFWLKALRDVPKNWAKARRNVPKADRKFATYDGSGNLMERGEHSLYEPDYYSQSALTRVLAHFNTEPGAHVFTPEQRMDYKASISDQAHLETFWHWRRVQALGKDLAEKLRPYSKLSVQLDRVLEGRAPESSLPEDARPAVAVMKKLYADSWEYTKARYKAAGLEPPTSKLEGQYVGPRLILGHISQTVERAFSDFLHEKGPTPEVIEMRNRFLHERTGDPSYREDAALRWEEYNRAMSKHLAFLDFFEHLRKDVRDMEATDYRRGAAIVNMLKATLLRRKGSWERWMDRALAAVRFAKASPDLREISLPTAAQHMGVDVDALRKGGGIERVFVVPEGAQYRVGSDAKATDLATIPGVGRLVATGGAHLFGAEPKIRPLEEALAKKVVQAKVAVKGVAEKVNKRLTGEEGGYLSPHFSKDEHVRMAFEEWKDGVLRSQDNLANAAFRAMGDRQTRAMLSGNWRAALANSMQPWLTLAPEIGWRNTLQAVIENSLSGGRGKRAAEHVGSLQGELARTGEIKDPGSWFRKIVDALGGMAPYKYAEDFTRGVGMMGASHMARRLGYKPGVAQQMSNEIDGRYFDEWKQKIDAMRQSGTTENLQATLDTETMFDYNLLGQSPIFGGPLGKVLGRLMTFPGRYARRYVTRPVGAAAKVGRAIVAGGIDKATGGALAKAGMKVGPEAQFVRGRQVRGKYPGPSNAFDEFLEYYGARHHDRQGAKVMLRQVQAMGAMAALTGVGINGFLMGTPGWERLPLMGLLSLTPAGSPVHRKIKELLDATQRSAVVDVERGVESTMSPGLRIVKKAVFDDTTPAVRKAMKAADAGKPLEVAGALSKPLVTALQEAGLQYSVEGLAQVRRLFQQMPVAERFFATDAGKGFAHVMGIKTYIKGNGAIGFIKGMTGLKPVAEEEKQRVRIDQKPPALKTTTHRRSGSGHRRSSIYSALLGGHQEAFA